MYLVNKSHLHHVIDIDIRGFFDNVNHGKLLKQIWSMGIRDKNLICIISKMLKAEIKGIGVPEKGTPQGGILSPLQSFSDSKFGRNLKEQENVSLNTRKRVSGERVEING